MKEFNKLMIWIIVIIVIMLITFLKSINFNTESHCNNNISIGLITDINTIGNNTIITIENNGTIKREVVDNYYSTKYNVNDSIIHCK